MFRRLQFTFPEGTIFISCAGQKLFTLQTIHHLFYCQYLLIRARYKNCSLWKCELKPSEHACKIFCNYSKPYVFSVSSQRKYNFYHQNTLLDAFRMNSRNIIGRNPSMVIPLLANQDLTPLLSRIFLQSFSFTTS